ncbi:MAG: hypothetical protein WA741_10225 [Candidatus Sulfotelmatobacter sp.]
MLDLGRGFVPTIHHDIYQRILRSDVALYAFSRQICQRWKRKRLQKPHSLVSPFYTGIHLPSGDRNQLLLRIDQRYGGAISDSSVFFPFLTPFTGSLLIAFVVSSATTSIKSFWPALAASTQV